MIESRHDIAQKAYGNITGSKKRLLTTKNIATELMIIMKQHIGLKNSISRSDLFKTLYIRTYDNNRLDHWMLWEFTRKAMHLLRRNSNCFISSIHIGGEYNYYVIKDNSDAEQYVDKLDNSIARMRSMQKKARIAVREGWYAQKWEITDRPNKKISYKKK